MVDHATGKDATDVLGDTSKTSPTVTGLSSPLPTTTTNVRTGLEDMEARNVSVARVTIVRNHDVTDVPPSKLKVGQLPDPLKPDTFGRRKSQRAWKRNEKGSRASASVQVQPLRTSWSTKTRKRREREHMLATEEALRAQDEAKRAAERERIAESRRRRAENELKGETKVIVKTAKVRAMSRKQRRLLRKA